jgi:hypothetical protein
MPRAWRHNARLEGGRYKGVHDQDAIRPIAAAALWCIDFLDSPQMCD